jgi:hypothetical protein
MAWIRPLPLLLFVLAFILKRWTASEFTFKDVLSGEPLKQMNLCQNCQKYGVQLFREFFANGQTFQITDGNFSTDTFIFLMQDLQVLKNSNVGKEFVGISLPLVVFSEVLGDMLIGINQQIYFINPKTSALH